MEKKGVKGSKAYVKIIEVYSKKKRSMEIIKNVVCYGRRKGEQT